MSQEQQQDGAGLQQQQPRPGKVQLGEFWLQVPNAWFTAAELKFEVAHITSEREHFAHAVRAMGFSVLRAVLDLVENPRIRIRGIRIISLDRDLDPYQKMAGSGIQIRIRIK